MLCGALRGDISRRAKFIKKILLIFCLCLAGWTFLVSGDRYSHLERFARVLNLITSHHFRSVPVERLVEGAIRGLLFSIDPHSQFLKPGDLEHLKNNIQGGFFSMGFSIENQNRKLTVTFVLQNSPAQKSGLRPGDHIISIDGQETKRWTRDDFILFLNKNKQSRRRIAVRRAGQNTALVFHIKPEKMFMPSVVTKELQHSLFYLRIFWFSEKSLLQTNQALRGKNIKGLILDLRGNPGGLFQQALGVADLFLDEGLIVSYKIRSEPSSRQFKAHYADTLKPFPLVVLIDGASASGAEILAGALKDHKRAVLLGQKSYGKGSLQSVFPLREGYSLKLTVGEYQTPSGGRIHQTGIVPDIVITKEDQNTQRESSQNLWAQKPLAQPPNQTVLSGSSQNKDSSQEKELFMDPEIRLAFEELNKRIPNKKPAKPPTAEN